MMDHQVIQSPSASPKLHGPHVVVIGGGASGVLMATHLLSRQDVAFRVTIIEGRHAPGRGVAYSTDDPDHLLNTRAHNMSAFPNDPGHFLNWLRTRSDGRGVTGQCFVSRSTYGSYLSSLISPWLQGAGPQRLRFVHQTALRLQETPAGVVVHLGDGQSVIGDIAVLATGHVLEAPDPQGLLLGAWDDPDDFDRGARVVIIGSGLSMVDRVITLLKAGHRGEILCVSRRGQLPRTHRPTKPLALTLAEIPLGAPMTVLIGWARGLARQAEQQGGTWRDAVDGIRPHVKAIWRNLPLAERSRFLRHAATWWDVHRHRIPPASEATLQQAMATGQMRVMRGSFLRAERLPGGQAGARILPSGSATPLILPATLIFDCRGIRRDPARHASPLIADLLRRGSARVDPLNIGLDVGSSCRLLGKDDWASGKLFAIGPVSRAAFWEITAIPDIREQTSRLAAVLALLSADARRANARDKA
ncbi:FAD/NAD(P)-binding protein [Frigidibacter sp.]|uniref:FAD/NAD(P)-binding protein n=1 Tax=Frigidibacter sp. TaxID=2586418 RepID=UPI0027367FD8|nr:FAD/NAD(P)-binding protein [Frigidibacter sp.]MDP3341884.1 FAD/NAD(P)-binding protein [Frigidibacter sp.]